MGSPVSSALVTGTLASRTMASASSITFWAPARIALSSMPAYPPSSEPAVNEGKEYAQTKCTRAPECAACCTAHRRASSDSSEPSTPTRTTLSVVMVDTFLTTIHLKAWGPTCLSSEVYDTLPHLFAICTHRVCAFSDIYADQEHFCSKLSGM